MPLDCLFSPHTPGRQAEAITLILLAITDGFEPSVSEVCRPTVNDFEEIDATGRHKALHRFGAAGLARQASY